MKSLCHRAILSGMAVGSMWRGTRMDCTIAVARRGQRRDLARICQVLRVTIARPPRARIFAWIRCRRRSRAPDRMGRVDRRALVNAYCPRQNRIAELVDDTRRLVTTG